MHDNDLDTFPEEHEASRRIVITDDQLKSSWETFPTEEAPAAPAAVEEPLEPQITQPVAPSIAEPVAPPNPRPVASPIVRRVTKRSRPLALAVIIVALVVGLFAGQAIVRRMEPASPVQRAAPAADVARPENAVAARAPELDTAIGREPARVAPPSVRVAQPPVRIAKPPVRITPPPRATAAAAPRATARPVAPPPPQRPPAVTAARQTVAEQPRVVQPVAASTTPAPVPTAAVPPPPAAATASAPPPVAAPSSSPAPPPAAAPDATPAAAPPAAPSAPAAPVLAPETRAVLGTLYRYQEAFSALDSNAAQQVWPDVDVRALDRAFDQLAQQTFDLRSCDVGIAGARAEAVCTGTASYARKVGNKAMRVEPRRWRFTLRREASEWLIDRVDVR